MGVLGGNRKLTKPEKVARGKEFSEWSLTIDERINKWKRTLPKQLSLVLNKSPDSLIPLEVYLNETYPNSSFFHDLGNAEVFDAISTYIGEIYRLHLPGSENLEWKPGTEITEWLKEPRYRFYFQVGFRDEEEGVNPSVDLPFILHTKPGKELFKTMTRLVNFFQQKIEEKLTQQEQPEIPGRGGYSYQHFILLQKSSFTLSDLEKVLIEFYAKRKQTAKVYLVGEDRLVAEFTKDFCFHFYYDNRPSVAQESKEISDSYKGTSKDKSVITSCKSRIEFWGDEDDNMDYFNEHLFLLSKIVEIPGVFVYDFKQGVFYDEM